MIAQYRAGLLWAAVICLSLAGCASTSLVNEWQSPQAEAPAPVRKVLVVGVTKQASVRRVFEDEFTAQLRAAGVEAIPGYTVLAEDGQAEQAVLEETVRSTGADGVLVTRLVKQEQRLDVTPGTYRPAFGPGLYGWYSSAWVGYYEPPSVYQYEVVTAETSLYSPPESKLVWSGTTETFSPKDVRKETAGFSKVIIGALRKRGLI